MAGEPSPWMDQVRQTLCKVFDSENSRTGAETVARVLFYLTEAECEYKDDPFQRGHPVWRALRTALGSSQTVFRMYAEKLAEDTKTAEKDLRFRAMMGRLYDGMLEISEKPVDEGDEQGFQLARLATKDATTVSAAAGMARALALIPPSSQTQMLQVIAKFCSRNLYTAVDELVSSVSKVGGNVVMVGLAVIFLGWEICDSIKKWYSGEISGLRCVKNITDASVTIGAGVGGGIGGAALGGLVAGPFGILLGGIVGGMVASSVANVVIDRITQSLFGVPKDIALENAYNFIGVKMTASNHDINQKYYALSRKCHPDRQNGNTEDFQILQFNMAVIKAARGELY
ncbi:hypothetical protein BV898_09727 [Hypsibius exemplaris]|uniref:J domain-containing protein n=1 Tax=Hypsibius exemplaris TaxID=2072580 RepID=A0A1W0WLK1_HYPEX|nr:hypothetical protein BV898_09727 [Hypsibius exemplaris]